MNNNEPKMTEGETLGFVKEETGKIKGVTIGTAEVTYSVDKNDRAIFEGDIVLVNKIDRGSIVLGESLRWPKGIVPYAFEPGFPDDGIKKVMNAIDHWHKNTSIRFVKRTDEEDFLKFIVADGLWSLVGKRTGPQNLSLAGDWSVGNAIHEMGHTVGLWHEQSRKDRDRFVKINYENIKLKSAHNFNQHVTDGDDVGEYDYDSIMHYPTTAFSINGQPTIIPLKSGVNIGQRIGLSKGDIQAVNIMYK
jgi:hypothetical protein